MSMIESDGRVVITIAIATATGALAGYVVALLALAARRARNRSLVAHGGEPYRDCVLPIVFVPLSACGALFVTAVVGAFVAPVAAAVIGSLAPAGVLAGPSLRASAARAVAL